MSRGSHVVVRRVDVGPAGEQVMERDGHVGQLVAPLIQRTFQLCTHDLVVRFGQATPNTTYDPDLLRGWGQRFFNWEFSTGVQHELLRGLGVSFNWYRRSSHDMQVTQNTLV